MISIKTISGTVYQDGTEVPFTFTVSDEDWVNHLEELVEEAIQTSLVQDSTSTLPEL